MFKIEKDCNRQIKKNRLKLKKVSNCAPGMREEFNSLEVNLLSDK